MGSYACTIDHAATPRDNSRAIRGSVGCGRCVGMCRTGDIDINVVAMYIHFDSIISAQLFYQRADEPQCVKMDRNSNIMSG